MQQQWHQVVDVWGATFTNLVTNEVGLLVTTAGVPGPNFDLVVVHFVNSISCMRALNLQKSPVSVAAHNRNPAHCERHHELFPYDFSGNRCNFVLKRPWNSESTVTILYADCLSSRGRPTSTSCLPFDPSTKKLTTDRTIKPNTLSTNASISCRFSCSTPRMM